MRRPAMTSLCAAIVGAALLAMPLAASAAPDLSGYWWIKDRSQVIKNGPKALPLKPGAAAAYAKNRKAAAAGQSLPIGQTQCLPEGLPRLMLARYPLQILQRPDQVTFLHERMHMVRLIYLNQKAPDDVDPAYNGYSVGRWEGDTLVVDSDHFNDATVIDGAGVPHSDRLKLTERFTLTDGGKTLRDQVTVDDPGDYTRPWRFDIDFARQTGVRLMEDVCVAGPPQRDRSSSRDQPR